MAFENGVDFISNYMATRSKQIVDGARLTWSGAANNLNTFSRIDEADRYEALSKGDTENKNMADIRAIRTRLGWLCACARDIKVQYFGSARNLKAPLDSYRHMATFFDHMSSVFWKHVKYYLGLNNA